MSVGSVSASNGSFYITDANGKTETVDLGTLMMMLNLDRTQNLDDQLAIQLAEIQDRNALIGQFTELLSEARRKKAAGEDDESGWKLPQSRAKSGDGIITQSGVSWTDVKYTRSSWSSTEDKNKWDATWDANINNIKSKIDTLNNDSQMANIKLQNLLEKRNNAFEMATKVMDTNNQSVQSTLRNL